MAIQNFIPEVWSARLTRILEPRLVLAQPRVMNRNWEGDIADKGDTVHIRNFTTGGSIRDYVRNTPGGLGDPDRPSDGETTLTVDQAKAFYIAVDDVDAAQSDLSIMDKFLERTARNLAVVLDRHAAMQFINGGTPNTIGNTTTPQAISHAGGASMTPYEFAVRCRAKLAAQSLPLDDMWMVVNSDLEAEFLLDPQFISATSQAGSDSVVRQGSIGRIAGFDVLRTEALPNTAIDFNADADTTDPDEADPFPTAGQLPVLFGDGNYSLTWADQVVKVEAERLQGEFGDALKGLNVYGAKIIEPESYGLAVVTIA